MTHCFRLFCSAAAVLSAACSSVPSAPTGAPTAIELAAFAAFDPSHFPGAKRGFEGFAQIDPEPDLRVGDAVLLGLEVDDGESVVRRMLELQVKSMLPTAATLDEETRTLVWTRGKHTCQARLTKEEVAADGSVVERVVQRDLELTPIGLQLRLLDEHGAELSKSTAVLYDELLQAGLWPACLDDAAADEGVMSAVLLLTLQRLGADDAVLHELLFTVVDKPSVFSVLAHFGISVVVSARKGTEGPALRLGDRDVDCRVLPVDLDVNGSRAMCVHILCEKPRSPGSVAAGIVGVVARHPTEPRTAVARLLAMRRGVREERVRYTR